MKFFIFIALACISQLANGMDDEAIEIRKDITDRLDKVQKTLDSLGHLWSNYSQSVLDLLEAHETVAQARINKLVDVVLNQTKGVFEVHETRQGKSCYLLADKSIAYAERKASEWVKACFYHSPNTVANQQSSFEYINNILNKLVYQLTKLLERCTPDPNYKPVVNMSEDGCDCKQLQDMQVEEVEVDTLVRELIAKAGDLTEVKTEIQNCTDGPIEQMEQAFCEIQETFNSCFHKQHQEAGQ